MVTPARRAVVLGNHEFNAIAWATPDPANPGEYLPHAARTEKVRGIASQHEEFLAAVGEDSPPTTSWSSGSRPSRCGSTSADCASCTPAGTSGHSRFAPHLHADRVADRELIEESNRGHRRATTLSRSCLKGPEIALGDGRGYHDKDGTCARSPLPLVGPDGDDAARAAVEIARRTPACRSCPTIRSILRVPPYTATCR